MNSRNAPRTLNRSVWLIGMILFGTGFMLAAPTTDRLWLILGLWVSLIGAIVLFPAENKIDFLLSAYGIYPPMVTLFYLLSFQRETLNSQFWTPMFFGSILAVGASVVALVLMPSTRRAMVWLMAAVISGVLIAHFSGTKGGGDPWVYPVMDWFNLHFTEAARIVYDFRKVIHFTFYGLMAFFAARAAFAAGADAVRSRWFSLAWTLPHACFDEFRQHFSAGRGASWVDVMIDLAGMLTFILLFFRPMKSNHE